MGGEQILERRLRRNIVESEIEENWASLIRYLQKAGMMVALTHRLEIKPVSEETKPITESIEDRRILVQNALRKRSRMLSRKLREDFSLGEIEDKEVDLSLIEGFLSEYAGDEEDSVEIVKSTRMRD